MNYYNQPASYPVSNSVSPVRDPAAMSYQSAYLTAKGKFDAGRAFDFEDDAEFCPALSDEEIQMTRMAMGHPHHHPSHHQLNANNSPYSYSNATTPPHSTHDMNFAYHQNGSSPTYYMGSPVSRQATMSTTPNGRMMGGRTFAPQPQRALDIIDPATGRVASPVMTNYSQAMPRY